MSRHRNIRNMDYDDYGDDYDDNDDDDFVDDGDAPVSHSGGTKNTKKPKPKKQAPASSAATSPKTKPGATSIPAATPASPPKTTILAQTPKTVTAFSSTTPAAVISLPKNTTTPNKYPISPTSSTSSVPLSATISALSIDSVENNQIEPSKLTPTPKSKAKSTPVKKPEGHKGTVRIVVIGHVDAGKSTVMGHLMVLLGLVDQRTTHKNLVESEAIGKKSFHFAWVLDESTTERARGVTVNCAHRTFSTPKAKAQWNIVDAPGHRDFIPNMIAGTAMADVALLVVDGRPGEFEAGFNEGGQTKEHALLARSLGVRQAIVVVNKMDGVEWSKQRFDYVSNEVKSFLMDAGWKEQNVQFVPVAALSGLNLTQTLTIPEASWYQGSTLLSHLEALEAGGGNGDASLKDLRALVQDIASSSSSSVSLTVMLESGSLTRDSQVLVMPANVPCIVKNLSRGNETVTAAFAGEMASVGLVDLPSHDAISVGSVLCFPSSPIPIVIRFEGHIITPHSPRPLVPGLRAMLHCHYAATEATITKLRAILDKHGEVIQKKPRCVPRDSTAIVEVEVSRPICLEISDNSRSLSRFTLRDGGHSIAMGVVTKILS